MGLSAKEAKVYLASLTLGASPVQKIAEVAKVNRATTYVMIESLTERGLMGSFEKGKKTLFTARPPEHLMHLLNAEQERVEKKKELFSSILPELQQILAATDKKPRLTLFEGEAGMRETYEELMKGAKKSGKVDDVASLDDAHLLVMASKQGSWREHASKKKIGIRLISTGEGKVEEGDKRFLKERRVPKEKFPFHGEIVVAGNKIAALSYKGDIYGMVIESEEVAQTLRALYDLAWHGAGQAEKK